MIILLVACVSIASAQAQPNSIPQGLLKAQDLRDSKALWEFLWSDSPLVRARAALAAGSVQDTAHIPTLMVHLDDASPIVRKAAAFALGQMTYVVDSVQRRTVSNKFLLRMKIEDDNDVELRIAEALGKVGDAAALPMLVAEQGEPTGSSLDWEIALSVGRYAYRGMKDKAATAFVMRLVDAFNGHQRWKGAYALMRIGDREFLGDHTSRIAAAAQAQDPDVRMYIATVLGKLTDKRISVLALLKLAADADWRVRVNALRALATSGDTSNSSVGLTLIQAIDDEDEHVSLTAISSQRSMNFVATQLAGTARSALAAIVENKGSKFSPRQQKEAAVSLAKLFSEEVYEMLREWRDKGMLDEEAYAAALEFIPLGQARIELVEYVGDADPRFVKTAMDALIGSCKASVPPPAMIEAAREAFVGALATNDLAVVTTASEALGDSMFAHESSVPDLLEAVQRLKTPDDAEAIVSIISALGKLGATMALPTLSALITDPDHTVGLEAARAVEKITGKPHVQLVPPDGKALHTNFDWVLLDRIRDNPEVRVVTSRGEFTFTLLPDDAPFTCLNFASLIDKKFFDGLSFHRVVSNFVVQGGDPRGDGWGGPGYAIRSEFGYESYGRGFVGVASSGKDTEGCQFFVTHSRQPHLDGRYTIFGKITGGHGVMDLLQIGDRIETMSFANTSQPTRRD
ncbi:MAG: peptidylprolyl isomerase [Bacteroidota bacterium]